MATATEIEIAQLEQKLIAKKQKARYMQGNRKGAWGITTDADCKREAEINRIEHQLQTLKKRLRNGKDQVKTRS